MTARKTATSKPAAAKRAPRKAAAAVAVPATEPAPTDPPRSAGLTAAQRHALSAPERLALEDGR
jgi:hypothetical protein